MQLDEDTNIELPIEDPDLRANFDKIEDEFRHLSSTILFTMRNEIRCHTMYYLDLAIREVCVIVVPLT